MVRPSILSVGPFNKKDKRTLSAFHLIQNLPFLQRAIPNLHLILVGPGATDCFHENLVSSLILVDSEKEIESYVFYTNAFVYLKGNSLLQEKARNYSLKIGCPVVKLPRLFWLDWLTNAFANIAIKQITSPSNLIKQRIHAASN